MVSRFLLRISDSQKAFFEYKLETCFDDDFCQNSTILKNIEVRRIDKTENTALFALFGLILIPIIGFIIWWKQERTQLSEMVKRIIVKWKAHSPTPKFQLIDEPRIIQLGKIASGQFGEVVQARVKPLGAESRISKMNSSLPESIYEGPIALKMVKSKSSNSAHDQFLEEASICAIFEHKNICKLIGLILGPVQMFDSFSGKK